MAASSSGTPDARSRRSLADGARAIEHSHELSERHARLKTSTFDILRRRRGISGAADGPAVCTLCWWPVEHWHPAARHDSGIVHAVCLDEREARARSRDGYGICPVCDREMVAGTPVAFNEGAILHLECRLAHRAAPSTEFRSPAKPGARADRRAAPHAPPSARGA